MVTPTPHSYQNCIAVCTTSSDYLQGYTATAQCNTIKELLSRMGNETIEAFSFTTAGKTQSFKNITASQATLYLACAIGAPYKKEDK